MMNFQVFAPQGSVHRLYLSIIEDVAENVRDSFLDEGLDESTLADLTHVWQVKLDSTKALDMTCSPSIMDRKNSPLTATKLISHSPTNLSTLVDDSRNRVSYPQKLITNIAVAANFGSKTEPLDFSAANPTHSARINKVEMNPAACLQSLKQHFKGGSQSVSDASQMCAINGNSAAFQQLLLNRSNCAANLLSLHRQDLPRGSVPNQDSQIKVNLATLVKEEPRFVLHPSKMGSAYESIRPRLDSQSFEDANEYLRRMNNNSQSDRATAQYLNNPNISIQHAMSSNIGALLQQHSSQGQPILIKQYGRQQVSKPNQSGGKGKHQPSLAQFDGAMNDEDPVEVVATANSDDSTDEEDELDRYGTIGQELSDAGEPVANKEESEPLNTDDDVSEEDPTDLFETDNIIVCQFDKINRSKARWKFMLKDGIMNIRGKDYVFSKAQGEADW